MKIIHTLNIADVAMMLGGVAVALLMIIVGAGDEASRAGRSRDDMRR